MAKAPRLKVFRTPIGFHDAYVAAPSQKAAIEAWGSGKDIFARGEAELVTDPALTAKPLADPGRVIKRLRGSAAEQIAALGPVGGGPGKRKAKAAEAKPPKPKKPPPRPSRAKLEKAEAAVAKARETRSAALAEIAERQAALERERRAVAKTHDAALERLTRARDEAEASYEEALRKWRG
ncbi:MAG: hypothetical protein ACK40O_02575 [Allosphingosinicella sp.]